MKNQTFLWKIPITILAAAAISATLVYAGLNPPIYDVIWHAAPGATGSAQVAYGGNGVDETIYLVFDPEITTWSGYGFSATGSVSDQDTKETWVSTDGGETWSLQSSVLVGDGSWEAKLANDAAPSAPGSYTVSAKMVNNISQNRKDADIAGDSVSVVLCDASENTPANHSSPSTASDSAIPLYCDGFGASDIDFDANNTDDFDFDVYLNGCQWYIQVTKMCIRYHAKACEDNCHWIDNPESKSLFCIWQCQLLNYPDWEIDDGNCDSGCTMIHENYHVFEQLYFAISQVSITNEFSEACIGIEEAETASEAKERLSSLAKSLATSLYVNIRIEWSNVNHCYAYMEEAPCNIALGINGSHTDPDPSSPCYSCDTTNYPQLRDNPFCPLP